MRTDVTKDKKLVYLSGESLSTLGYGKWKAQAGDFIMYNENHSRPDDPANTRVGRIIGRIDYAPQLEGDPVSLKNWLIVAAFSDDLTFCYERWVNPESVSRCWSVQEKQRELWAFMTGDDFKKHPIDDLRQWLESGFPSWEAFAEWKRSR